MKIALIKKHLLMMTLLLAVSCSKSAGGGGADGPDKKQETTNESDKKQKPNGKSSSGKKSQKESNTPAVPKAPKSGGSGETMKVHPVPLDKIVEQSSLLPPDPGAPGKATLQGIDIDQDGVRDDVQIKIYEQAPDDVNKRSSLRQFAVFLNGLLLDADHKDRARNLSGEALSAMLCVHSQFGPEAVGVINEVKWQMLNTYERSKAFAEADRQATGMTFTLGSAASFASKCRFKTRR